uniref:Uncharacterized protein n=1 Tax=Oryza brachyantha TaxID=4533 RepID=J3M665_ORYBR
MFRKWQITNHQSGGSKPTRTSHELDLAHHNGANGAGGRDGAHKVTSEPVLAHGDGHPGHPEPQHRTHLEVPVGGRVEGGYRRSPGSHRLATLAASSSFSDPPSPPSSSSSFVFLTRQGGGGHGWEWRVPASSSGQEDEWGWDFSARAQPIHRRGRRLAMSPTTRGGGVE